MHLVLKLLFCACAGAPMLALLGPASPRALACAAVVAGSLFLLVLGHVDPLSFGMLQVDGALQAGVCGVGLRPSR
jgi:hypothetical protein